MTHKTKDITSVDLPRWPPDDYVEDFRRRLQRLWETDFPFSFEVFRIDRDPPLRSSPGSVDFQHLFCVLRMKWLLATRRRSVLSSRDDDGRDIWGVPLHRAVVRGLQGTSMAREVIDSHARDPPAGLDRRRYDQCVRFKKS
jgi:hypothetical protein